MGKIGCSLGTMEMGRNQCIESVPSEMIKKFINSKDIGADEIDTAIMYCGGKTEKIVGNVPVWKTNSIGMATKVNPWNGKGLGKESVRSQFTTSLASLKVDKVQILYLHAPDHDTPILETLTAVNDLHKEGKFDELGLSNYSAWLVAEVVNVCKQNGFVMPTVYQGMYSAITRQVEVELIPCLRYYGMRFYAYSPLGGGILSGKHTYIPEDDNKSIQTGRFNMQNNGWDKIYRDRYWKEEHFNAMNKIAAMVTEHHEGEVMTMAEIAYRWLLHHSALDGAKGDRIVIGASRVNQLETNLSYMSKGALAQPIVEFFEEWWQSTKHLCPTYLR